MDFGPAAQDYATFRQGFPESFFARVPLTGRVLDLGSGTGTLARGYAARRARVVALDHSTAMLRQTTHDGRAIDRVAAKAEACPLAEGTFDAIVAGQCWHWFDAALAAAECRRLLRRGGTLTIARMDYLADSEIGRATEALILQVNPGWPMAGGQLRDLPWRQQLRAAGFGDFAEFTYDEDAAYSHEAWRGRIRACNGVIALADERARDWVDDALGRRLREGFPDPLLVPHRIVALTARVVDPELAV